MSPYLNETEERISQPGLAQPAHVAKRASKSKRIRAICLLGILVLGVSLAVRSVCAEYRGDIGVYIDALGTVTPISAINVFSQVSGQVLAVHYAISRYCVHVRA